MKKTRFDKAVERKLLNAIEGLTKTYALVDVKHAAAKFLNRERVRAAVAKERRNLEARLRELEEKA